jgi:cytoskeleton protein RodZ
VASLTEGAGTGVGAELTRAREEQGLALVDVAQQLKFAPRQLEALEQERFGALPGPTIARGMLRNYAKLLKLDADALLARLGERLEAPDAGRLAARFSQPVPFSDSARRSSVVYAGISVLVLGAVSVLAYQWHRESKPARQLAFVPAAKAPAEPVQKAAPAPVPVQKAPLAPVPPPTTSAQKASAAVAVVPKPPSGGANRIVVRCEEECWIEVKDGLERQLVSSLNPAGSERVVRGQPPYEVVIGNASHARVTYNDRPVDLQPHTRQEVARFTLP